MTRGRAALMRGPDQAWKDLRDLCEGAALGDTRALMLYGSRARGDHTPGSDVDVLQVVPRRRPPYHRHGVSVTAYTESQLRRLAKAGSLFILHLREEGILLADRDGVLRDILDSFAPPAPEKIEADVRTASAILDVDGRGFAEHPEGYCRVAIFLLRTLAYAQCLRQGKPIFSLEAVAARLGDDRIVHALKKRNAAAPTYEYFSEIRNLLFEYLGTTVRNPYGSLEALAVNTLRDCPFASALAVRVATVGTDIDYAALVDDWIADEPQVCNHR